MTNPQTGNLPFGKGLMRKHLLVSKNKRQKLLLYLQVYLLLVKQGSREVAFCCIGEDCYYSFALAKFFS